MQIPIGLIRLFLLVLLLARAPSAIASDQSRLQFDRFFVVPIRLHLFQSDTESALSTALQQRDLQRIIRKVNRVWAQAGIFFEVESVVSESPAANETEVTRSGHAWLLSRIPSASHPPGMLRIYFIHEFDVNGVWFPSAIFVKETASLRPVPGGIDEPMPRVTAHELGHALGLEHRQAVTNLMASGTTGTSLNQQEIEACREVAAHLPWIKPVEKNPWTDASD